MTLTLTAADTGGHWNIKPQTVTITASHAALDLMCHTLARLFKPFLKENHLNRLHLPH